MSGIARRLERVLEIGLQRRRPGAMRPFTRDRVRRILVVRKDNIGDVLCTTPALRALRRAFPAAHLAILFGQGRVDRISVEEVMEAIEALLSRSGGMRASWAARFPDTMQAVPKGEG